MLQVIAQCPKDRSKILAARNHDQPTENLRFSEVSEVPFVQQLLAMPTKQAVDEFKEIYLRQYGLVLTDADATDKATSLIALYRTVYSTANMKTNMNHEKEEII